MPTSTQKSRARPLAATAGQRQVRVRVRGDFFRASQNCVALAVRSLLPARKRMRGRRGPWSYVLAVYRSPRRLERDRCVYVSGGTFSCVSELCRCRGALSTARQETDARPAWTVVVCPCGVPLAATAAKRQVRVRVRGDFFVRLRTVSLSRCALYCPPGNGCEAGVDRGRMSLRCTSEAK